VSPFTKSIRLRVMDDAGENATRFLTGENSRLWRKRERQQNRPRKKSSHGTSNCMCPYADGEIITNARLAVCLVAFTLVLVLCGKVDAQKLDAASPPAQQHILSLNFTNNGQQLVASVGQQIEITLGTVGGPQYGKPEVSSAAIRLECVALGVPVTPGGPTFTYIFGAAAEGQAQVNVPIIYSVNPDWTKPHTFSATIHVGPASGNPRKPHAFLTRTSQTPSHGRVRGRI
jgi:hypothetical protein